MGPETRFSDGKKKGLENERKHVCSCGTMSYFSIEIMSRRGDRGMSDELAKENRRKIVNERERIRKKEVRRNPAYRMRENEREKLRKRELRKNVEFRMKEREKEKLRKREKRRKSVLGNEEVRNFMDNCPVEVILNEEPENVENLRQERDAEDEQLIRNMWSRMHIIPSTHMCPSQFINQYRDHSTSQHMTPNISQYPNPFACQNTNQYISQSTNQYASPYLSQYITNPKANIFANNCMRQTAKQCMNFFTNPCINQNAMQLTNQSTMQPTNQSSIQRITEFTNQYINQHLNPYLRSDVPVTRLQSQEEQCCDTEVDDVMHPRFVEVIVKEEPVFEEASESGDDYPDLPLPLDHLSYTPLPEPDHEEIMKEPPEEEEAAGQKEKEEEEEEEELLQMPAFLPVIVMKTET